MKHQNETEKLTLKLNTLNVCAFDKMTVKYTKPTHWSGAEEENKEVNNQIRHITVCVMGVIAAVMT